MRGVAVIHTDDHDPLLMYERCDVCWYALNATWVQVAPEAKDMDPGEVVRLLRRHLLEVV